MFKSHDPAALPALDRAIAKETDASVKQRMEQARAAATARVGGCRRGRTALPPSPCLAPRADIDSRSLLAALTGQPPAVAAAVEATIIAIDRACSSGASRRASTTACRLGSVLLLAAAGLAITFGVMGVINMAHGEMVMIGAYVTFMVQQVIRDSAPGLFGASLLIAIPLAFIVAGLIGIAIERTLIRWLYGRPLETLLATWGLSLMLQQAVRSIFGANNREVGTPGWMSGATELGGLTLTYNRLYIILFAFLVLAALMAALRFTSLGLAMRAVTQNRRMAAAMGIRTPWIDALTFGLGSGVAGHGRRGAEPDRQRLAQSRPGLHHRQLHGRGVRRRRQSLGHRDGRAHARHRQQVPRTGGGRGAGQDRRAGAADPVHPTPPARHVPAQGTGGGGMTPRSHRPHVTHRAGARRRRWCWRVLNLCAPTHRLALHVPTYAVALAGKYLCFAMLALAVDLVWGFAGILSLGHAAFFALGGYAMGMYLMRQIGARGVYGNANLPDFMVFLGWHELPWYWHGFEWFGFAALMVVLVPGMLALVFGWLAFRSRVTGVYLSIITQALTYALLLAFFRNDMGFGGNNGMTDFKDILGFPVQAETTRCALLVITALFLCGQFLVARHLVTSRFGKVLIAVRDAEAARGSSDTGRSPTSWWSGCCRR